MKEKNSIKHSGTSRWNTSFFPFRPLIIGLLVVVLVFSLVGCSGWNSESDTTDAQVAAEPTATPKPAPKIPPASEQNDLLKIAINAQGSEERVCYLTFDDGPTSTVTPSILATLKQYNVKATFFMLGRMIEDNPDLAKQVHAEGHLLANHSYSHSYGDLYATPESFYGEIEKTEALIRQVTGEEPFKLMRFPGGSHNAGAHAAAKQQYKLLLQEKGYYYADWNCLNGDAEGGDRTPEQLLNRLKDTAIGKNLVVLMHDAANKQSTADSLPLIIDFLQNQGYVFRRMDEVDYYPTATESTEDSMIL